MSFAPCSSRSSAEARFSGHTHATMLLASGVPAKVLSERLGHAAIVITLRTYAHVLPAMHCDATARIAALIDAPLEHR